MSRTNLGFFRSEFERQYSAMKYLKAYIFSRSKHIDTLRFYK